MGIHPTGFAIKKAHTAEAIQIKCSENHQIDLE